jgi:transposase-like protein
VVHRDAPLTETGRLRLARCIVEHGWPVARAAERFQVARTTAEKWSDRYREFGPAGMADRSSRPHRSPRRTPQPIVRKIVHLRWKQRLGPVAIAARVGPAPSTAHRILVACRINRLWHIDRVTGEPVRRYEMSRPGELVHVDIKKSTSRSRHQEAGQRSRRRRLAHPWPHPRQTQQPDASRFRPAPQGQRPTEPGLLLRPFGRGCLHPSRWTHLPGQYI